MIKECLAELFRNCSTEFQAIPLPSLESGPGAGLRTSGHSGSGLPARGRDLFRASHPSTWVFSPADVTTFSPALGLCPFPDPPSPCLPPLPPVGSCPPPSLEHCFAGTPGGVRSSARGIGGRGREEKWKAEARENKRREGSRLKEKRRVWGWWRALLGSLHSTTQAGPSELGERAAGGGSAGG